MRKPYDANPYYWYAATAFTGIARVQANKHSWTDVVAGGTVGYLSSKILTNQKYRQSAMFPKPSGLAVSYRQKF